MCVKGFVKCHVKKGSDKILGATIVGSHAGDLISELTLAMQSDTGVCVCNIYIYMYVCVDVCMCVYVCV